MDRVLYRFLERGADPLTLLPSSTPLACDIVLSPYAKGPWLLDKVLGDLIFQKVPISLVMSNGNTVLHELCMRCHPATRGIDTQAKLGTECWIEILLKRGADPNHTNDMGQSPPALLLAIRTPGAAVFWIQYH